SSRTGRNRSSWRSSRAWLIVLPRQRILPTKESRTTQIGNPKPQENPHAYPAFLQNRLLHQTKSSRSINRLRLLHGPLSLATPSRSLVSIAPVRWATERLSCNSATICSSPSRWRQRVSDERSNGSSCRNTTSPQKYWKYGFSTHRSQI